MAFFDRKVSFQLANTFFFLKFLGHVFFLFVYSWLQPLNFEGLCAEADANLGQGKVGANGKALVSSNPMIRRCKVTNATKIYMTSIVSCVSTSSPGFPNCCCSNSGMNQRFVLHMVRRQTGQQRSSQQQNTTQIKDV